MSLAPPMPVVFAPLLKEKPWGGCELARLFHKSLPDGKRIGESWELVSLPSDESRVARGPHAGRTISELVQEWGAKLLGGREASSEGPALPGAELIDGRFPLLIKFLDAREHLSVQVHPKQSRAAGAFQPGVKNEAWYVVDAAPGAEIFVGLRRGVTAADVARAANTPELAEMLQRRPVKPGQCYYLPSGVVHALGAGIVVAEVQTPSDITYRLYDWQRVDERGRPRELHIEQALANLLIEVPEDAIVQPRSHVAGAFATVTRLVRCERFLIDHVRLSAGLSQAAPLGEMAVWIVLRGEGVLSRAQWQCEFRAGDTLLLPADDAETRVETISDVSLLEVKVPLNTSLAGLPHPPHEIDDPPLGGVRLAQL
ncbi:putative mannose-6-phosphate isomerase YvyI [Phycisphaerae bacterium RAS1]|nr:putative mannose-6-phosphate isomerase YvyI [Phycisphaerae bacterium RAS1]